MSKRKNYPGDAASRSKKMKTEEKKGGTQNLQSAVGERQSASGGEEYTVKYGRL